MKLYLHIGTEKTGSSFLQSYLATNRSLLEEKGIHFPHAGKNEKEMSAGRISPGNGADLNDLLEIKDWSRINKYFLNLIEQTTKKKCDKILLSNEILIKTFSIKGTLKQFIQILSELKIELQPLFLIVREPVSHAMSMYKHRSKRGEMLPIDVWLKERYVLPDALKGFYKITEELNIKFEQYLYKKDSDYLLNTLLNKWLLLDHDYTIIDRSVNPSLTLSELFILSKIKAHDDFLAKRFYSKMIGIDTKHKANDKFIIKNLKNIINNYMVSYNNLWVTVQNKMSHRSEVYNYQTKDISDNSYEYSLSEQQIVALSNFIDQERGLVYNLKKFKYYTKKQIIKALPGFVINYITGKKI